MHRRAQRNGGAGDAGTRGERRIVARRSIEIIGGNDQP
jgi:hypothetical protein